MSRYVLIEATCSVCGNPFSYWGDDATPADHCGAYWCIAHATWSDARWAGQARMARARADAGLEPQRLDHVALARVERAAS